MSLGKGRQSSIASIALGTGSCSSLSSAPQPGDSRGWRLHWVRRWRWEVRMFKEIEERTGEQWMESPEPAGREGLGRKRGWR